MLSEKEKQENLDIIIQETQELMKEFDLFSPVKIPTDCGLVVEIFKDKVEIRIAD